MQTDDDLVERLQSLWPTGCGDEAAGAKLMDEAATRISELTAEIARLRAGADDQEPRAWMYEYTRKHPGQTRPGACEIVRDRYSGSIAKGWTETPLYRHPPATTTAEDRENPVEGLGVTTVELIEALRTADDAIREMFRYFDGGETRGSYDGRPERNQLRKAGDTLRRVLARTYQTGDKA